MPTFDTPEPISVTVELRAGDVRIVASDRYDTKVEVRPTHSARKSDVAAAAQTRVEYAEGRLSVKAPKGWKPFTFRGDSDSIDVEIALPTGSDVRGDAAAAAFRCTGRLGDCNLKTAAGEIHVDEAGAARFRTARGDITVDRSVGDAEVTTASGAVRIDHVDGTATVKNSNGDTWIGRITGELHVNAANGRIVVEQAQAAVEAKTANGDVRLLDVTRGAVVARTACGKVDIGVHDGVAAWLDLDTSFGNVRSELTASERPEPGEDAVEVVARTAFGDITIRRAQPATDSSR